MLPKRAKKEPVSGVNPARMPQMPAYHLKKADNSGITMVNIGVGPSNAKTITDHIAVLRPHAWMMLGHCAGLRNSQALGDYVLAHAYVREDNVLNEGHPAFRPCPTACRGAGGAGAGCGGSDRIFGLRTEEDHAHRNGRDDRQSQLGTA